MPPYTAQSSGRHALPRHSIQGRTQTLPLSEQTTKWKNKSFILWLSIQTLKYTRLPTGSCLHRPQVVLGLHPEPSAKPREECVPPCPLLREQQHHVEGCGQGPRTGQQTEVPLTLQPSGSGSPGCRTEFPPWVQRHQLRPSCCHSSSLGCDSLSDGDSSPGFGEPCWSGRGCSWGRSTSSGLKSIFTRSSACTLSCKAKSSQRARTSSLLLPREQWHCCHRGSGARPLPSRLKLWERSRARVNPGLHKSHPLPGRAGRR